MNEEQKIDESLNWWYDISDHQTTELIIKHKLRKPIKEQDIVKLFALYGVNRSTFTKEDLKKAYNNGSKQGSVNGMRVARGGEMNIKTFDEWYNEHYR